MPRSALLIGALACLLLAFSSAAQAAPLQLDPVGTFQSPTYVTAPPGDIHRVFVVERPGRIQVLDDGLKHQFLDLTGTVLCCAGERGLASVAFPPDYATSGRFYVQYTAISPTGAVTVAEYRRSAADPDAADPDSGRILLSIPHDRQGNHDGGQLQFGPDGLLYIGVGDGGSGGDPAGNGQNLTSSSPAVVNNVNHDPRLGKLLRIDPGTGSPYTVPEANPFAAPAREVFAYGLRNPWRFSFDRLTGDLVVSDVGQDAYEEVDLATAPGNGIGRNYGWSLYEGLHTYPDGAVVTPPFPSGYTFPVLERSQSLDNVCSMIGGYVVRDPNLPELAGQYVYGDFCNPSLRAATLEPGGATGDHATGLSLGNVTSFGEDACARIYVMSFGGEVDRISNGSGACTAPVPAFPGVSRVSIDDVRTPEGDAGSSPAMFTVRLSRAAASEVTVEQTTSDGSASHPADYTATSGRLTFAPGETSKSVAVPVAGDTLDEDDETFSVDLSSPTNAVVEDGHAVGTIADDDPTPSLSLADASVTEGDAGTADLAFTATLSAASGKTVTAGYHTSDGTAHQPGDYAAASGTLTFAPGETSKTVHVAVAGDAAKEADETLGLTLTDPSNATLADGQAQGTIVDDDATPVLSVADETLTEGDSGTRDASLTVSLTGAADAPVTVHYATSDGSAHAPGDYTATTGTLTFDPGQTERTITVPVVGDTVDEDDETFAVDLDAPANATIGDGHAVTTITDDDAAPVVSVADATAAEGTAAAFAAPSGAAPLAASESALTFAVTLTQQSERTVTVDYATVDGTARQPGDYTQVSGTLTFAPGQSSKEVVVPIAGDAVDEDDETLALGLSGAVHAAIADGTATGTIQDDDAAPSLALADAGRAEGDSGTAPMTFTATLSAASERRIAVHYSTSDGSAHAPVDYTGTAGTLTFAPGDRSAQITVAVAGDAVDEDDEGFSLDLDSPANASLADAHALGTIVDDDAPPTVSIGDVRHPEGDTGTSDAVFTVSLSAPSGKTISVDVATSDGTATGGTDYTPARRTVTFAPGETRRTVDVGVAGDRAPERDETFHVGHAQAPAAAVGTIADDDPALGRVRAPRSARLRDLFCRAGARCRGVRFRARYGGAGAGTWRFKVAGSAAPRTARARSVSLPLRRVSVNGASTRNLVLRLRPGRRAARIYRAVRRQTRPTLRATLEFTSRQGQRRQAVVRVRLHR